MNAEPMTQQPFQSKPKNEVVLDPANDRDSLISQLLLFTRCVLIPSLLYVTVIGCTPSNETQQEETEQQPDRQNTEQKPSNLNQASNQEQTSNPQELANNATLQRLAQQSNLDSSANSTSQPYEVIATPNTNKADSQTKKSVDGNEIGNPNDTKPKSEPTSGSETNRLSTADLSAQKLVEFLAMTDRDMQDIWGRLQQMENGRDELIRIAKMKLQASQQLATLSEATEKQRSLGARGELQALSHLASFGDIDSAEALKTLAEKNILSDDDSLASDSRLVLIGFALESLKQGKADAKDALMNYLMNLPRDQASNDVPTLMVMGQARDTLAAYGEQVLAAKVRDKILEIYQDSANPDLRSAAMELANHALYDEIETLLASIRSSKRIPVQQWESAVNELLTSAGDMQCLQYLASCALQLEGLQLDSHVKITFDALAAHFDEPDSETARELAIASSAYAARQIIIGTEFSYDLPAVNNRLIKANDYQGKILLVPFWTIMLPESLQLISSLEALRDQHPEQIAILGINLDGNDELLNTFLQQNEMPFKSLRASSSNSAETTNQTATKYGVTSMPFLAIVSQSGKIAAVNFTGQGIEETVKSLLK